MIYLRSKRFIFFFILAFWSSFTVQAWAKFHEHSYDPKVSPMRNKVADYAYEILNYTWEATSEVLGYKGKDENGNYLSPYKWSAGTTIYGLPYADSSIKDFREYKEKLSNSQKSEKSTEYQMKYGMVCASLVTDCIRQGFTNITLNRDDQCLFHKRGVWGTNKVIRSVPGGDIWKNDHSYEEWTSIWTNIQNEQRNSGYPAYQSLKKGDYLDN